MKKKKHKIKHNFKQIMEDSILNHSKTVPLYDISNSNDIKTKGFYNMTVYDINKHDKNNYTFNDIENEIPNKIYKCKKICLSPTYEQSKTLLNMMNGYRIIFNETVSFINKRKYNNNIIQEKIKAEEEEKRILEKKIKAEEKEKHIAEKKIKPILTKEEKQLLKIEKFKKKEEEKRLNELFNMQKEDKPVKKTVEEDEEEKRLNELSNMQKEDKPLKKTKEEELKEIEQRKKKRIEKIERITKEDNCEISYDSKILRTYFLKEKISDIAKKFKTPIHSLDKAVELACASFKSAESNLKNGHIKKYRIRKLKTTKSSLVMDIEKQAFSKDGKTFIKTALGKEFLNKSNFLYNVNHDCKIHYNKSTKKFILIVPEKVEKTNDINNTNYISIVPGIRTFLSCTTNKNYIEIGNNIKDKLNEELLSLDKREKIKKSKKRNRYTNIMRERIKNQINDTHHKIIHYLTKTYKTIVIGRWSTKSIISNKNSVLSTMNKRIATTLSFYSFIQKLKYKCLIKNVNLHIINEHYTSKMCTNCGKIKKDLKGDSIYHCKFCDMNIKRDYNGARNIFLKSIKSINI